MFWITKYRHNQITAEYQKLIDNLHEQLNRKKKLESILDKLVDKTNTLAGSMDGYVSSSDFMDRLDDTVPRYVHDVNGGKVIRQEATPVTILDADGKATYGYTKEKPDKGYRYQLKRQVGF